MRNKQEVEIVELEGQAAKEALASDFGVLELELVPIERDGCMDKVRKAFDMPARDEKRGVA